MATEKCCATCEFCMSGDDDLVCAGGTDTYGMKIKETEKMFPNGCDEWEISIKDYCREHGCEL